ncbi:MAG: methyltransferase domain-containing protein [Spirochaetales bacterium]|nr:methyltransferase domain-containing protein [Spirochaetales bacterium]
MVTNNNAVAHRTSLIVAEHRVGHGSGHLHRCARVARELGGSIEWLLPVAPAPGYYGRAEALQLIGDPDIPVRWVDRPSGPYDLVIIDRREATLEELRGLDAAGLIVGIDLAGEARRYCSYLIDTLRTPTGLERANLHDIGLLHLPEAVREAWPERIDTILVAFGGEAISESAYSIVRRLSSEGYDVTIATPRVVEAPPGVRMLRAPGDLAEKLHRYDAVITHYGLTAYEALWARVPVILMNPTPYHRALAAAAGFLQARSAAGVVRFMAQPGRMAQRYERIRPTGRSSLVAAINALGRPERFDTPTGGDRWQPALERFAERTFFCDSRDDLVYMQRFGGEATEYGHDYFFSEYRDQYGRTYLEDFDHIRVMGTGRMDRLLKRYRSAAATAPRLLDIGCAYGPFLSAATETGCIVKGIDISEEAVAYVRDTLGHTALQGDILSIDPAELGGPFDIVTMWYVIEHFFDLDRLLNRIADLVRPGGLFSFSTPNARGISAMRNRREFLRCSPQDHYTILDPRSTRTVLKRAGFTVRTIYVTGHHPERFGIPLGGRGEQGRGVRRAMLAGASRLLGLGDTFEVVAERDR